MIFTAIFYVLLVTFWYHLLVTLIGQICNHNPDGNKSNKPLGNFGLSRWKNLFLQSLQIWQKWNKRKQEVKVDDVVLLTKDFDRNKWPIARVVKIEPGSNDKVTSVQLRTVSSLTLFRIGLFRAAHGWGEGGGVAKKEPLFKLCHTYPNMMKLDTVIPYLKKIQKYINQVTHSLSSADINIFSLEISKFSYVKKYIHRMHVNA